MKRTTPMFSVALPLVLSMLLTIPVSTFAQSEQGKVETAATPGANNSAAQTVVASVTSQSLMQAVKAAGIYGDKDSSSVDWYIDGAVSAHAGKRILFAAFPRFVSRGKASEFYFMSLDIASKKLIALPISHLVGVGVRIVSSPQSSKAVAYIDKGNTDEVFAIDKSSLESVKLIPDSAGDNFDVNAIQFDTPGKIQITIRIPARPYNGSRKFSKWVVMTAILPTASQLKQVVLTNQKQLKPNASQIKIGDIAVQKNWARCSIEVPGLDTATVIFKHEGLWKFVSLGTSFVDPPAGMPPELLD